MKAKQGCASSPVVTVLSVSLAEQPLCSSLWELTVRLRRLVFQHTSRRQLSRNMSTNMPPSSLNLESQLLSIMDVLVKAAVAEISQLFSESCASLRLHLSQSLKENEALRMRMKVMRSEVFSLKLQTRHSRPCSRFSPSRGNIPKPRANKSQGEDRFTTVVT